MGIVDAVGYVPVVPTFAIRIFGSDGRFKDYGLKNSELYRIHEYTFDDNDPHREGAPGRIIIDGDIAREIIEDFRNGREGCSDLLVHCSMGEKRSPAVAIALNDIFDLGADKEALRRKYSFYDRGVYDVMMKSAD